MLLNLLLHVHTNRKHNIKSIRQQPLALGLIKNTLLYHMKHAFCNDLANNPCVCIFHCWNWHVAFYNIQCQVFHKLILGHIFSLIRNRSTKMLGDCSITRTNPMLQLPLATFFSNNLHICCLQLNPTFACFELMCLFIYVVPWSLL